MSYAKPTADKVDRVWILISETRNPLGGIDHLIRAVFTNEKAALKRLHKIDTNYKGQYPVLMAYDLLEVAVSRS